MSLMFRSVAFRKGVGELLAAVLLLVGPCLGCKRVKGPAASKATALCISNEFDEHGRRDDGIARDVQRVCGVLGSRGLRAFPIVEAEGRGKVSDAGDAFWPELRSGWADEAEPPAPRLLFYEGHGNVGPCGGAKSASNELCLLAPEGKQRIPWHALLRGMPARRTDQGWTAIILNACDSGFADVRNAAAPFSLIGSGYGLVPRSGPQSGFAALLSDALGDASSDLNCDSVLSDRELQEVLNVKLKRGASSASSNAVAVVRRQANADVPVLWLREEARHCDGKASLHQLLQMPPAGTLPCSLLKDLQHQAQLLRDKRGTLVESAIRYLFVDDQRTCDAPPGDLTQPVLPPRLAERALALGYVVVPVRQATAEVRDYLQAVGRFATFTELYLLTISNGGLSLTSLRDTQSLLTLDADLDSCAVSGEGDSAADAELVRRVIRCLPTRVSMVGSGLGAENLGCRQRVDVTTDGAISDQCRNIRGGQTCLSVRVDGRFPSSDVRVVEVADFLTSGAGRSATRVDWERARPIPCLSARGQCFSLPEERSAPRLPGDWLFIEGGLEQLARETKEQTCE